MTTIDFKGWWCVRDVEDDRVRYAVCDVVGQITLVGSSFGSVQIAIRYPDTGEVFFALPTGEDLFMPADRALAEAHAAKKNADQAAFEAETNAGDDDGEDSDEAEEAA